LPTANGHSVTLPGPWITQLGSVAVTLTGLGPGGAAALTYSEGASDTLDPVTKTLYSVDGGVESVAFETHPGFADFVQTEFSVGSIEPGGVANAISKRTTTGADVSYDTSDLLPTIESVSVDATDSIRPTVHWTSSASLSAASGIVVITANWSVLAPSTAVSVRVPELPAGMNVPWVTGFFAGLAAVGGDEFADYDAFRTDGIPFALSFGTSPPEDRYETPPPLIPPLSANGTMKVSIRYEPRQE
jgi:hypothetical protein